MDPIANWLAGGALLISVLGYLDNRRRISNAAVAFQLEFNPGDLYHQYRLRNTGTRRIWWLEIDADSVVGYELRPPIAVRLKPGEATDFGIVSSSGLLPDSLTVKYRLRFVFTRERERTLAFQPVMPGPKVLPPS